MLDIEKIRQLIEMMVVNDLSEISLRDGDLQVNLKRPHEAVNLSGVACPTGAQLANTVTTTPAVAPPPPSGESPAGEPKLVEVVSPMVGTFYSAPDPESPPFVQVGGSVSPGSVLCLLEAMKTFSEIKAELAGTIERILVKNLQPVEFGQPLFVVRPV